MYDLATCRASILRGTTTDTFGDPADNATVVASGIATSIRESTRTVFDQATQTPRVVRRIVGTMPSNVDVRDTDRVRDDTNNVTYIVDEVTRSREPGFAPDLILQLKRIT